MDALHHFYLHDVAAESILDAHHPHLFAHIAPALVPKVSAAVTGGAGPATGVLKVTVSAAQAGRQSVVVRDCYDQTNYFGKGKNGKPIIFHSAEDRVHESWVLTRTKGVWTALTDAGGTGC